MKLNVDGSHGICNHSSTCGGILNDDDGLFLKGFFCKVTSCNVMWAEIRGILSGLRIARDMEIPKIIVDLDGF